MDLETRPRLRRKEAADYLKRKHGVTRTLATLNKLASQGGGPEMQYDGRIPLYTPEALDAYAARCLSGPVRSTSERKAVAA